MHGAAHGAARSHLSHTESCVHECVCDPHVPTCDPSVPRLLPKEAGKGHLYLDLPPIQRHTLISNRVAGHEGTKNSRTVEMANAARKSVKPFPGNCGPEQNRVEFDESICMLF